MVVEEIDPITSASQIVRDLHPDLSERDLHDLVSRTSSSNAGLYVAAFEDARVVGFTAFRAHRLLERASGEFLAFQAAGVLTSRNYRGRGIFPKIVLKAEEILRSRNGLLVFGFPNANAYPVWKRKLGYDDVKLMKWRAPMTRGFNFLIAERPVQAESTIVQDDRNLIASKQALYGNELVVAEVGNGLAWGVRRSINKFALRISVLDIGGMHCHDGRNCKELLAALIEKKRSTMVRLTATESNPIFQIFRMAKPASAVHEVVIYKWLSQRKARNPRFAFYTGMTDWF